LVEKNVAKERLSVINTFAKVRNKKYKPPLIVSRTKWWTNFVCRGLQSNKYGCVCFKMENCVNTGSFRTSTWQRGTPWWKAKRFSKHTGMSLLDCKVKSTWWSTYC